jgi:hypothetical protein
MPNEFDELYLDETDPEIQAIAEQYRNELENFEGTLILNPVQYKKFVKAVAYLKKLATNMLGGKVSVDLTPKQCHGLASVEISILDLKNTDISEFIDMLQKVNVFSIDPSTNDSLIVGINVNDIYKQVE